ncbi:MAG: hypothetical protein KC425_18020 [Anaerolineales bacterium]|nr:hypothetical protein [Anaerolineales bacterium]
MMAGIELTYFGGYAPIQAWGTVNGRRFYFRARWDTWRFEIGKRDVEVPTRERQAIEFIREGEFAPDAGHEEMAIEIVACFRAYFAEVQDTNVEQQLEDLAGQLRASLKREVSQDND